MGKGTVENIAIAISWAVRGADWIFIEKEIYYMTILTASEWLISKKIEEENIDFIESLLTYTSAIKVATHKENVINSSLKQQFPSKQFLISPNMSYFQFEKTLKDNNIDVEANQLLEVYKNQGLCKSLCNEWLDQFNRESK